MGLPEDFPLGYGEETQVNNRMNATRTFYCQEFSKLLLRELAALRLIGVLSPMEIWRKPHPIPAYVTLCTAAWILANSAYGKLVAIHILSGEHIRLRFCRYVLIDRYDIF